MLSISVSSNIAVILFNNELSGAGQFTIYVIALHGRILRTSALEGYETAEWASSFSS